MERRKTVSWRARHDKSLETGRRNGSQGTTRMLLNTCTMYVSSVYQKGVMAYINRRLLFEVSSMFWSIG